MDVGLNYPWCDYGWDFGLGPPAWRGDRSSPRWYNSIDDHLDRFRALGITVVRWFVLADGLTYGTGVEAPRMDDATGRRWGFEPPPLDGSILDHFDELLRRFGLTGGTTQRPIQILPVLIDFLFCRPGTLPLSIPDAADPIRTVPDPDWVKQGRADVITDERKRNRFLDEVLEGFLRVSMRHRHVVYAWELMNEPDLITTGWRRRRVASETIDEPAMRAFLDDGQARIRRAGFRSTIGFASIAGLRRAGITSDINQFHHYPGGRRWLGRHAFDPRFPGVIGEFATKSSDVWPDLLTTGQNVLNRLRLAKARGYRLAIPWSFHGRDRHTSWSAAVEQDIAEFTAAQEV
jgi:hypothetical protein